jgi:hypothetical protein
MTQDTQKKKRQNREYVVELEEPSNHRLAYTLGALGGLVLSAWLTRNVERGLEGLAGREAATRIRGSNGGAPAQFRPGRLRREPRDQDELLLLEDAVLDAFLDDALLCDRGIDVGAISLGIVELSGSVFTRGEAAHAVAVAQGVEGVATVVNRMEIEDERGRLHPRFDTDEGGFEMSGAEWTGNQSGMGRRRQGSDTDPARPDDSQFQREEAIEQADRAQFADEGHYGWPRVGERDEVQDANRTHYREDELDNQSPYGQHAVPQGNQDDGPPRTLNSQSRVGEGLKPGVELALEAADLPLKPHQHPSRDNERGA